MISPDRIARIAEIDAEAARFIENVIRLVRLDDHLQKKSTLLMPPEERRGIINERDNIAQAVRATVMEGEEVEQGGLFE